MKSNAMRNQMQPRKIPIWYYNAYFTRFQLIYWLLEEWVISLVMICKKWWLQSCVTSCLKCVPVHKWLIHHLSSSLSSFCIICIVYEFTRCIRITAFSYADSAALDSQYTVMIQGFVHCSLCTCKRWCWFIHETMQCMFVVVFVSG